jgi:4-diphosphocytidyl-2-C-methyl-D-erythritol kinase
MPTKTFRTEAPAKLNIRLKITGKRPDGYHELVSIMVPVSLLDFIEVQQKKPPGVHLSVRGLPVPEDESNLVSRAAHSFLSHTGLQEGLSIRVSKNIPVAAGLGGGSSDAAATLLLLNEIYSTPLSARDLRGLALQLGADVPFFLRCEPCLATGIGEILEPLGKWPELWYIIVSPQLPVSTAWVYQHYRMKLTTEEHPFIKKQLQEDSFSVSQILENDLESVTSAKFPIIRTIKGLLMENGAEGALMSGSGSSVFGVFGSLEKAESARERLTPLKLGDVFVTTNYRRQNTGDRIQETEYRSQKRHEKSRYTRDTC